MKTQSDSNSDLLADVAVAHAAADVVRKAHAVGLVDESPDFTTLTYPAVKRAVLRVREAGIGEAAAADVMRAWPDAPAIMVARLREIGALLEESPLPATEWGRLLEIFERDQLASLLGLSPASVVRYARGERQTPDAVAARLHCLALIVGDLAGAYNEIGIRRWFNRARTPLNGRSPAQILRGDWQPEEAGPRSVRELARALVSSPAT
jgi:hypothetical protein